MTPGEREINEFFIARLNRQSAGWRFALRLEPCDRLPGSAAWIEQAARGKAERVLRRHHYCTHYCYSLLTQEPLNEWMILRTLSTRQRAKWAEAVYDAGVRLFGSRTAWVEVLPLERARVAMAICQQKGSARVVPNFGEL